jgi:signal transduction histidine kinase
LALFDMVIPHPVPCVKKGHGGKLCWLSTLADGNPQADVQEDILVCNECASFREIINRGFGRRNADLALGTTIAKLLGQVSERNIRLEEARQELEKKVRELALMKIITDGVVRTTDLSKALRIILTGVTSGRAFGFNRAGIFLVDQRNEYLDGQDAVGPENWQAATKIWGELQPLSFEQLIKNILDDQTSEKGYLHKLIEHIRIPLSENSNILVTALWAGKPSFFRKGEIARDMVGKILKHLDFNEFVAVPLQAEGMPLGLMVADNFYTNKPITEASMDALATLANTCTSVLEITLLHKQLSLRLEELERVNQLLRENQSYLLQAERLADVGKLAATVAHEFKTPLVTIGSHARRALRDVGTAKFKKKDLEIIASEIIRLEGITSELLEYTRPSKFDIESQSMNQLVRDSLEFMRHKLNASGIKLKTSYCEIDSRILVDEKRFRQVMLNITDNALDAMGPGMVLRVETRIVEERGVVDIIDSGCGIPREIHDKIFTLFFTTKSLGSGLGLSVSKKIVEDHGGFIEFESTEGCGTRFSIYFPATNFNVGNNSFLEVINTEE